MIDGARFVDLAEAIGHALVRDALWSGSRCGWTGDAMEYHEDRWQVVHRMTGPELYSGTAGIGLFLAELAALRRNGEITATAAAALRHALDGAAAVPPSISVSFYSGLTGIACAAWRGAILLELPELSRGVRDLVPLLLAADVEAAPLDVVGGCAGAVLPLVQLGDALGRPELRGLAERLCARMTASARQRAAGVSFATMPGAYDDLTGFSHGAGGIGWALLEMSAINGDARLTALAESGFAYERACYDPVRKNWPDFREAPRPGADAPSMSSWCHGAPGIALSRLVALARVASEVVRQDAEIALEATVNEVRRGARGPHESLCLCHGLLGNCEPLLLGAEVLNRPELRALVVEVADGVLAAHPRGSGVFPCGVPGGDSTPGLMLGLAGVGHFMLRLAHPATPSVLVPSALVPGRRDAGARASKPGLEPDAAPTAVNF
jgi:lantibiotic modifying enzyme